MEFLNVFFGIILKPIEQPGKNIEKKKKKQFMQPITLN